MQAGKRADTDERYNIGVSIICAETLLASEDICAQKNLHAQQRNHSLAA
mgnify:CR=1 FL=1